MYMQNIKNIKNIKKNQSFSKKYIPYNLTRKDRTTQRKGILQSRKAYLQGRYVPRPHLKSFKSHTSSHIRNAQQKYNVTHINASSQLARKTHCKRSALQAILHKGRGAYYSSGSRPNQTAESWAKARLASALTHGNAAKVDKAILLRGCAANSPVF